MTHNRFDTYEDLIKPLDSFLQAEELYENDEQSTSFNDRSNELNEMNQNVPAAEEN